MCKLFHFSYFLGCIFLYNFKFKQHKSKTFKEFVPETEEYNKIVEEYYEIIKKKLYKNLNKYIDY